MYTQEQASKLINTLLFAAQKARSNLTDPFFGLPEDDPMVQLIKTDIAPRLFGDNPYNLVTALARYSDKFERIGYVTPGDMCNVVTLVKQEMALQIVHALLGGDELPEAMSFFVELERPAAVADIDWL